MEELMREFLVELPSAGIHDTPAKQAIERLPMLIGEFERRPHNRSRDGRFVLRHPRRRVIRTLRNLVRTTRDARDGGGQIRQEARSVLRAIRTFQDFETMEGAARHFIDFRNKTTARHNMQVREARARRIEMEEGLVLRHLVTVAVLKSVSQRLQLCAHDPDHGYLDNLRDGRQVFWAIERDDDPVALLAIDPDTRTVDEANGYDHDPIGLPQAVMLDVLRKLNVSADECKAFTSIGAYKFFLSNPVPEPTDIPFDNSVYRVWGRNGTILICRDGNHWSQFSFEAEEDEWSLSSRNDGDMDWKELAILVLHCPDLAAVVRGYCFLAGA